MTSAPRIVGIDATPLESPRLTGVGQYVARLLAALAEADTGWRPVLLAQRPHASRKPLFEAAPQGLPIPWRYVWMQLALPLVLRRMRPAVCHFTNSVAPVAMPCPYVLTIHDMSLRMHPDTHPARRRWLASPLLRFSARHASAVIAVSSSARADILRLLKLPPEKVYVVNEAAGGEFRPVTDRHTLASVSLRYALDRPFILAVGAVEPRKNLLRLFEAFRRLRRQGREEHLVIAGPLAWKFHRILRDARDAGPIRFLGFVPAEDLPALYSLARVFVFPSLYEGFGLPLVEAMACGTPVVTSTVSSMPEIAAGAAVLTDPLDPDSIADGIARVLRDDALREQLRQAGLSRSSQFSWSRAARETSRVYDAAAERHAASG